MRTLVVDASVAIKWVVEEVGTPDALALRRYRLSAPDLLIPECANILWKKVRRQEISREEALLAARLLERADVDLVPMRRLLGPAIQLATVLDHPAYDCIYLSLAQSTGYSFVTADTRFCVKVQGHTLPDQVLDLADALDRLDAKSRQ